MVDFTVNEVGAQGDLVRITSEMTDGQLRTSTLSVAEVEMKGVLGNAELFAEVDGNEYAEQNGRVVVVGDGKIGCFDNGDYVTYSTLKFGTSGTAKSIALSYFKGINGGNLQIGLGDENGEIIGTFDPSRTGGWYAGLSTSPS